MLFSGKSIGALLFSLVKDFTPKAKDVVFFFGGRDGCQQGQPCKMKRLTVVCLSLLRATRESLLLFYFLRPSNFGRHLHFLAYCTGMCVFLPLRHDLVGIWKIAVDVLHLERVGITDLVIRSAIVGALNHYDITSWTPQVDGVTLTRQLSPY